MSAPLSRTGVFAFVHVLLFNLLQRLIYRHHDFVSMPTMRLVYSLGRHIAWGALRLDLPFR